MSNKGRVITVHFTFVLDLFASARPLKLCIINSSPNIRVILLFILVVCMTAEKGQYQMTPLDNCKIPKLDYQT